MKKKKLPTIGFEPKPYFGNVILKCSKRRCLRFDSSLGQYFVRKVAYFSYCVLLYVLLLLLLCQSIASSRDSD